MIDRFQTAAPQEESKIFATFFVHWMCENQKWFNQSSWFHCIIKWIRKQLNENLTLVLIWGIAWMYRINLWVYHKTSLERDNELTHCWLKLTKTNFTYYMRKFLCNHSSATCLSLFTMHRWGSSIALTTILKKLF